MKDLVKKYLLMKWWFPILMFFSGVFIFGSLMTSTNINILKVASYLLFANIVLFLVLCIWQFFKGKWYWGVLQFVILCVGIFATMFITTFALMFGPDTDTFADHLSIPKNIDIEYPIQLQMGEAFVWERPDSMNIESKEFKFQLYNSFQPGLFEYDIWINSEKSGLVFLKAFEITQNIELSEYNLKERSSVHIEYTKGKTQKFSTKDPFTIYEGDWGKPYGARFEVWFKEDHQNKEVKLFEKNYVIEGWMR